METSPVNLTHQKNLEEVMCALRDGISEYTFAGIFLFRNIYHYRFHPGPPFLIFGKKDDASFAMAPQTLPSLPDMKELFTRIQFMRGVPERLIQTHEKELLDHGYVITEDRDHFDYVYTRNDLANLPGKKYHKKRNLVSQFIRNYSYAAQPLSDYNEADAYQIIQKWRQQQSSDGDMQSALDAIQHRKTLNLQGSVLYGNSQPIAYSLGEFMPDNHTYLVHYEKADISFKGVYQFLNMHTAATLPESIAFINREQDVGNPGLRQAKMTYHPTHFVRKYQISR